MVRIGLLDYETDEQGFLLKRIGTGRIATYPDKDGYLKYHLEQNTKVCNVFVHRVIWTVFNGPISEGLTVDHIDEDRTNNEINNLQLMTAEDNAVKGNAKLWIIRDPLNQLHEIYNMEDFCRVNGLHAGHMREVCNEVIRSYKGWRKA